MCAHIIANSVWEMVNIKCGYSKQVGALKA